MSTSRVHMQSIHPWSGGSRSFPSRKFRRKATEVENDNKNIKTHITEHDFLHIEQNSSHDPPIQRFLHTYLKIQRFFHKTCTNQHSQQI